MTKYNESCDVLIIDEEESKDSGCKGDVFKEISLNSQDGKFFHQFEGLFVTKTKQ